VDLTPVPRKDFQDNYQAYAAKARELLDASKMITNADVCRAMGKKNGWGHRYWRRFLAELGDALEGERKVRWKPETKPQEEAEDPPPDEGKPRQGWIEFED
jgi:hypothetical protein